MVQQAPPKKLIPQQVYTPLRANKGGFTPKDPIDFSVDGVLGISVSRAISEDYAMLDGRDDRLTAFQNTSVLCRMQVGSITSQTNIPPTQFLLVYWPRSACVQSKEPRPYPVSFLLTLTHSGKHSRSHHRTEPYPTL